MHLSVASAAISLSCWAWWPHWAATGTSLTPLMWFIGRTPSEAFPTLFLIEMLDLFIIALRQMVHVQLCWRKDGSGLQSQTRRCSLIVYPPLQHPRSSCADGGRPDGAAQCPCHMLKPKTVHFSKECAWTRTELWFLSRLSMFSITEKVQLCCGCVCARVYSN